MQVKNSSFKQNKLIPIKYTCKGENISPPLSVSDVPAWAKSLALIAHDPDSPGGPFMHWVVWNIDPATTEILEDSAPSASNEGVNDFGTSGYGGPCPHSGTHRYIFTVFALDSTLNLPPTTSGADVLAALLGHVIEKAELTGVFAANQQ